MVHSVDRPMVGTKLWCSVDRLMVGTKLWCTVLTDLWWEKSYGGYSVDRPMVGIKGENVQ